MMICPNCKTELEEGAKFCDNCGAQVFETVFCSSCGEGNEAAAAFCQKCGTALKEEAEVPAPVEEKTFETVFCPNCGTQTTTEFAYCPNCGAAISEEPEETDVAVIPAAPVKKKGFALPKKAILFGGIGAAVLVVLVLLIAIFSGGSKADFGLYLKDGEIFYTDYSKNGNIEVTSRLVNGDGIGDSQLARSASAIGTYITFSEDGDRMFFPDRIDDDSEGITLYYRDINKPKKEAVKIDSDVTRYAINKSGTQVVYTKGSDGILYRHDLEDKEKIASGVVSFTAAEDLKKVGYRNEDDSYYLWYANKDAVKVASEISSIEHVAEDLSSVYYMKDGALYKYTESSGDKEKIASDVAYVSAIYDSGELYYSKEETSEKNLLDYVDDDMAAADAAMTEPQSPEYPESPKRPSWWDYDSDEEYNAAKAQYETEYAAYEEVCDQLKEAFNKAYDEYWAKVDRDELREDLKSAALESTEYTLYYYDGKEATAVTDAMVNKWGEVSAADEAAMVLKVYDQEDVQKVKLSEVSYYSQVYDLVNAARNASARTYVAVGTTLSAVEQSDAAYYRLSPDGRKLYFLDEISDVGEGDLYEVVISGGTAEAPEMYDSDVSNLSIFFLDGAITYFKNADREDDKGDLYIAGEEIDYDVYSRYITDLDGSVLYYTDWNSEKSYGTLKLCRNGKKTKVADDVHDFEITNDDEILYLYDYSTNYYTGTLYLYKNGKAQKIDDDVIALIPVYTQSYVGG